MFACLTSDAGDDMLTPWPDRTHVMTKMSLPALAFDCSSKVRCAAVDSSNSLLATAVWN